MGNKQRQNELARLLELTQRHKKIMDNENILVIVNRNASGFFWELVKADGGTNLGWSDHHGNCEMSGAFKSYEDALEDALDLIEKCNLKKFRKETPKGKFHWGNYADHLHNNYRKVGVSKEETPKGKFSIYDIMVELTKKGINTSTHTTYDRQETYLDLETMAKSHLFLLDDGEIRGRYDYKAKIDLSQDIDSIITDLCKEFSKAQHLRAFGQDGWIELCRERGVELQMLM